MNGDANDDDGPDEDDVAMPLAAGCVSSELDDAIWLSEVFERVACKHFLDVADEVSFYSVSGPRAVDNGLFVSFSGSHREQIALDVDGWVQELAGPGEHPPISEDLLGVCLAEAGCGGPPLAFESDDACDAVPVRLAMPDAIPFGSESFFRIVSKRPVQAKRAHTDLDISFSDLPAVARHAALFLSSASETTAKLQASGGGNKVDCRRTLWEEHVPTFGQAR